MLNYKKLFIGESILPLHFTLFISSSIVLGFIFGALFSYIELNEKLKKHFLSIDIFLRLTWSLALVFTIIIIILLYSYGEDGIKLTTSLAPLGIIIAAFIASASVMKSIASQKEIELDKIERDILVQKEAKNIYYKKIKYQELRFSDEMSKRLEMARDREIFETDIEKQRIKRDMFNRRIIIYDNVRSLMTLILQRAEIKVDDVFKFLELELIKILFPLDMNVIVILEELENHAISCTRNWKNIDRIDNIIQKLQKDDYISYSIPEGKEDISEDEKKDLWNKISINKIQRIDELLKEEKEENDKLSEHCSWILNNKNEIETFFVSHLSIN